MWIGECILGIEEEHDNSSNSIIKMKMIISTLRNSLFTIVNPGIYNKHLSLVK